MLFMAKPIQYHKVKKKEVNGNLQEGNKISELKESDEKRPSSHYIIYLGIYIKSVSES